jgi:hypothetical protein
MKHVLGKLSALQLYFLHPQYLPHQTTLSESQARKKIFIYKLRQRKSKGVEIQTTSIKILKIENAYH